MSVSLGERMKYLLKKKKISQRQLADKCGISEQTITDDQPVYPWNQVPRVNRVI